MLQHSRSRRESVVRLAVAMCVAGLVLWLGWAAHGLFGSPDNAGRTSSVERLWGCPAGVVGLTPASRQALASGACSQVAIATRAGEWQITNVAGGDLGGRYYVAPSGFLASGIETADLASALQYLSGRWYYRVYIDSDPVQFFPDSPDLEANHE